MCILGVIAIIVLIMILIHVFITKKNNDKKEEKEIGMLKIDNGSYFITIQIV